MTPDRPWLLLAGAVGLEVLGTSLLQVMARTQAWWPAVASALSYGGAFWLLAQTLRSIPLGVAYAAWSALGTALIALIGWVAFRQALGAGAILGLLLIIAGVTLLHLTTELA